MIGQERKAPSGEDLRRIALKATGAEVATATRFTTGNHHFVHDVVLADGRAVVIRIAYAEEKAAIEGAVTWSSVLRPRSVPLPRILHADTRDPFPYLVLERLPGTDIGHVYQELGTNERRDVVARLVDIQRIAIGLGDGMGFGYAASPDEPAALADWGSVIQSAMLRTRGRLEGAGDTALAIMDRLDRRFASLKGYLDDIRPTPFLHDMTSKNVLIDRGHLSGIVDVDSLCYGDPLYLPGLIGAAFAADRLGGDYVALWKDVLGLDASQRDVVDFYSAQCLAYIIGEIGLPMNRTVADMPDAAEVAWLGEALARLLGDGRQA